MGIAYNPALPTLGLALYLDPKYALYADTFNPTAVATITNSPTVSADGVRSIDLPSNQILTFADVAVTSSPFLTIMFWTKGLDSSKATSNTIWDLISKKVVYNQTQPGWQVCFDFRPSGGPVQLRLNDGSTLNDTTPTLAANRKALYASAVWTHSAIVLNNTSVIFYVNGVAEAAQPIPALTTIGSTNPFSIGYKSADTPNIRLGATAIYNRVLSDIEVVQTYNLQKGRYGL